MSNETPRPSPSRAEGSARGLRTIVHLVAQLRAPDGCPWDRRQTHDSLKGHLIEEAYETVAAIEAEDAEALAEELGDLLLHVAFHIQIARESGAFRESDVVNGIVDKLIRRHPHVFGEAQPHDEAAVNRQWEQLKTREKEAKPSVDDGAALPALIAARKRLDKRSHLGDLPELAGDEQWARWLDETLDGLDGDRESQLGRMLLQVVEAARQRDLEPELCLRRALSEIEGEEQP